MKGPTTEAVPRVTFTDPEVGAVGLTEALASVGEAIRSTLRDSDFAGRNGGEEFAVILPNTNTAGALATAESFPEGAIAQITVPRRRPRLNSEPRRGRLPRTRAEHGAAGAAGPMRRCT